MGTPKANEGTQGAMQAPYTYLVAASVMRFSKSDGVVTAADSFLVHSENSENSKTARTDGVCCGMSVNTAFVKAK
jgi:hypothetical protein